MSAEEGADLYPRDEPEWPEVPGFRFGSVVGGIYKSGRRDIALMDAGPEPVTAAGVFTRNRLCAAPVHLCRARIAGGHARALLVNSGNANAATGAEGARVAEGSSAAIAAALGCPAEQVLVASTGVIGVPLPEAPFVAHAAELVDSLRPGGLGDFAHAILTTDRFPKLATSELVTSSGTAPVVGVAKGAGMIHPDMATTLAFVFTSASVESGVLARVLRRAADATFNCITVDGDTSTNDTLLAFASGAGDVRVDSAEDEERLLTSFVAVLDRLGRMIVRDGEGAEHCVTVRVAGAPDGEAAKRVARTVATSPLVKTALHGCDPNWGRLLAAAGRAGVEFPADDARVTVAGHVLYDREPLMDASLEARVSEAMKAPLYEIELDLRAGEARAHYHTSDLGHGYVELNADYRT